MIQAVKEHIYPGGFRKVKNFVFEKPLIAIIYSLAMKILAILYFFYFPPFSCVICSVLVGSSLIFDLAAITSPIKYTKALFADVNTKYKNASKTIKNFIVEKVMKFAKEIFLSKK
jgi:hypothetical protein